MATQTESSPQYRTIQSPCHVSEVPAQGTSVRQKGPSAEVNGSFWSRLVLRHLGPHDTIVLEIGVNRLDRVVCVAAETALLTIDSRLSLANDLQYVSTSEASRQ